MIVLPSNSYVADLAVDTEYDLQSAYGAVFVKGDHAQTGSVDISVAPPKATGANNPDPNYGSAGLLDLAGNWQRVQCSGSDFPIRYIKMGGTGKVHIYFAEKMMQGKHT